MRLSIVSTLYKSEAHLDEFYKRISQAARSVTDDYELILVNDASPDQSLELARVLFSQDNHVVVIDLARNYKHHRAMMTGLSFAKGDYVFLIDSDLEEEPELLLRFWEEIQGNPLHDVVYGYQERRKGGLFERISGRLALVCIARISDLPLPVNQAIARIMTRRYVQSLVQHLDQAPVFLALCALTGFVQKGIPIKKGHKSSTTYTFLRKIDLALNFLFTLSESKIPLFGMLMGSLIAMISCLILIAAAIGYLMGGDLEWPYFFIIFLSFFFGWSLFACSLLLYVSTKLLLETRKRPYTVVKHVYAHENA